MAIAYLSITDYSKTPKRDGKQAIHIHFPESLSKMGWNIRWKGKDCGIPKVISPCFSLNSGYLYLKKPIESIFGAECKSSQLFFIISLQAKLRSSPA